jgi:hypothetical protein
MKDKSSNKYHNQIMKNENHIICINDEIEIDQVMQERENPSLQIKISRIAKECDKTNENKTKHILQHLHIQRKNWHLHNRNVIYWSFYCVNEKSKVNLDVIQMMHCLLFHFQPIIFMNPRKQLRKGLISYYKYTSECVIK